MRILALLLILGALLDPAAAARLPGTYSNAFTGQEGPFRFVGRMSARRGTLSGRVRCAGCPVRGRLTTICQGATGSYDCTGALSNGCSVSGSLYNVGRRQYFEGQFGCPGGLVGSFSIGRR
jgi:hypothetical protein